MTAKGTPSATTDLTTTLTVIAIDGPSGSGKSTLARLLADELDLAYLDTGAMYRAVALAVLEAGGPLADEARCEEIAAHCHIEFESAGDGALPVPVALDGRDVTAAIRTTEVSNAASIVAAYEGVRAELVLAQRAWAVEHGGGVIEGRDIGSVVFPDAVLKIFLTAPLAARASRRAGERVGEPAGRTSRSARGGVPDAGALRATAAELAERDERDRARSRSPLRVAPGAIVVDTTDKSPERVLKEVLGLYERAVAR